MIRVKYGLGSDAMNINEGLPKLFFQEPLNFESIKEKESINSSINEREAK